MNKQVVTLTSLQTPKVQRLVLEAALDDGWKIETQIHTLACKPREEGRFGDIPVHESDTIEVTHLVLVSDDPED